MYTDLPQFTRCCFCAPLRIGLLIWGYIKLIISLMEWLFLAENLYEIIFRGYGLPPTLIVFMIAELIDVAFTIILIIAAHKKHERLFHWYYVYAIVFLVLLAISCGLYLLYMIVCTVAFPHPYLMQILLKVFVAVVSLLFMQVYITLLVRSELIKLRDRTNMQFSNQAGEAQCNAYVEKV